MLPRVKEALERAEKARFYKERIHRNTVEALLLTRLTDIEQAKQRRARVLSEEVDTTRMLAIELRDEEVRLMRQDASLLEAVQQRVEASQRRVWRQKVKHKSDKARAELAAKHQRWRQQEAVEADWRLPAPERLPQIRLNPRLLWPGQKEIGHFRRLYRELVRRPESRLGEKCIQALRERYLGGADRDKAFLDELEQQLTDWSPFVTQWKNPNRFSLSGSHLSSLKSQKRVPAAARESFSTLANVAQGSRDKSSGNNKKLPSMTKFDTSRNPQQEAAQSQIVASAINERQRQLVDSILRQTAETRQAIRHWELENSTATQQQLSECRRLVKLTVRQSHRRRSRPLSTLPDEEEEEKD